MDHRWRKRCVDSTHGHCPFRCGVCFVPAAGPVNFPMRGDKSACVESTHIVRERHAVGELTARTDRGASALSRRLPQRIFNRVQYPHGAQSKTSNSTAQRDSLFGSSKNNVPLKKQISSRQFLASQRRHRFCAAKTGRTGSVMRHGNRVLRWNEDLDCG